MSAAIRKAASNDLPQIHEVINDAARAYKGIIPQDTLHEPYMSKEELETQIFEGVSFSCHVDDKTIVYEKNGFKLASREDMNALLKKFWNIPPRQVETSVVLADEKYFSNRD